MVDLRCELDEIEVNNGGECEMKEEQDISFLCPECGGDVNGPTKCLSCSIE